MAAFLASTLTYLLYRRMRVTGSHHASVQVVAAAADIPLGVTLTAKDLKLLDWPNDIPLAGSISSVDEVVGHPLIVSLGANEPILKRDLGVQGAGIGLAGKIPAGMRATAVRSNEIVGVAGFLYPGSRVDVLATYSLPGRASNDSALTQTILQDVEVLTAGQTIEPDREGKPEAVNVVTLLLNPEDSQRILLASAQGSIQFVLRSGADQNKVTLGPTRLGQLVAPEMPVAAVKPKLQKARKLAAVAEPPVMEIILGTQRTVQKVQ